MRKFFFLSTVMWALFLFGLMPFVGVFIWHGTPLMFAFTIYCWGIGAAIEIDTIRRERKR